MRTIGRHVPADLARGDFVSKCDYCGAPFYRSQLRRDGSQFLVCELCDTGPDMQTQLRRNAELAEEYGVRQADLAEPVYDGAPFVFDDPHDDNPEAILGSDCACWLRAESAAESGWSDETGNLVLTGEPITLRSSSGAAAVEVGGSNLLTGTLTSPLRQGTRPYIWIVGQFLGDEEDSDHSATRSLVCIATAAETGFLLFGYRNAFLAGQYETPVRTILRVDTDAPSAQAWGCDTFDRKPHAFECSMADSDSRVFVDEVEGDFLDDASSTDALSADHSLVTLGNSPLDINAVRGRIRDLVISRVQPTAAILASMRAYCAKRVWLDP